MKHLFLPALCAGFLAAMAGPLRGDQVVMQNGDLFNGAVLSVSTNGLVLKNEYLGIVTLPRAKVVSIHFGAQKIMAASAATNAAPAALPVPPAAAPVPGINAMLRGIRADTNLIQQVQQQIIGPASPAAAAKFNEMLDGLSTGKMDMNSLRAEAQSTAAQLRAVRKDLGPEAGDELDGYLSILEAFLRETAPAGAAGDR